MRTPGRRTSGYQAAGESPTRRAAPGAVRRDPRRAASPDRRWMAAVLPQQRRRLHRHDRRTGLLLLRQGGVPQLANRRLHPGPSGIRHRRRRCRRAAGGDAARRGLLRHRRRRSPGRWLASGVPRPSWVGTPSRRRTTHHGPDRPYGSATERTGRIRQQSRLDSCTIRIRAVSPVTSLPLVASALRSPALGGWCQSARPDPLSELVAFPGFDSRLRVLLDALLRHGRSVGLAIGDVDHLKEYVETANELDPRSFGHLAGNALMRDLGHLTIGWLHRQHHLRAVAATFGGDEVIIAAEVGAAETFHAQVTGLAA